MQSYGMIGEHHDFHTNLLLILSGKYEQH